MATDYAYYMRRKPEAKLIRFMADANEPYKDMPTKGNRKAPPNGYPKSAPSGVKDRNQNGRARRYYVTLSVNSTPRTEEETPRGGRLWASSAPSTRICYQGQLGRNAGSEGLKVEGRMMEKAGFTRTLTSQENRTWFEDDRYTTQRQADYLTKLRRLRSELINQESSNLTNAVDRMNNPEKPTKDQRPARLKGGRRNPLMESGPDSFPSRHMRLMQEKRQRIFQHRQRKASPKLESIEGKQLVDPALKDDSGSTTSKSRSEGDETVSRDLLRRLHREKDIAPVFRNLIQPTHSIPNIGTRALRRSDKELNIDSEQRQGANMLDSTCVKQINIPKRGQNVQKDYKLRGLLDGSKDEMVVNPAALQYLNYQYDEESGGYYVPASSPVEGTTADEVDMLGTNSSNMPFRLEKIHLAFEDGQTQLSYSKPKSRPLVVISDTKNTPVYKSSQDDDEESESRFPEIHTKRLQQRTSPENKPLADFKLESNSKKQIVVEMPNIMFMPSTPEPSIGPGDNLACQGPLTKALTQNKIREREVKNLLQDVKDLNQLTEQLEERAKIEEARS